MHKLLRILSLALLLGTGLGASAQGHIIYVAGHMNPCTPANAGGTVNIHVYGHQSGPVAISTTLNENCYYYAQLLVPDTAGIVFVGASCSNGIFFQDSTSYSLTPPFTTDVIIDLYCGQTPTCQACYTIEQGAPFTATFNPGCSSGTSSATTYVWDFSPGGAQTGATVTRTFNGPGEYAACLNISDGNGCTSSICHTVYVDANGNVSTDPVTYDCLQVPNGTNLPGTPCQIPGTILTGTWSNDCECIPDAPADCEASFWVIQAYENGDTLGGQPMPNELWIWNLSSGGSGAFQFLWNFDDGTTSTEAFPTHTYAQNGPYIICLTVTDATGCTDTYCDSVGIDENGMLSGMVLEGDGHQGTLQGDRSEGFTINVMNPLTMAVPEVADLTELATWPNPAQDRLDVTFHSVKGGQVRTEVIDANGRRVAGTLHRTISGKNRLQLEVADLPAGMYLLRIGDGAQSVVRRFVKAD
ncbi:MAG: PKD domain-containing protein [Flavobacteriales bacterium]|nr:PKD domain-containing protein [Flavobacteriales bacterium]